MLNVKPSLTKPSPTKWEREGPVAQQWEGVGAWALQSHDLAYQSRSTLTLPALRAGSLPLPQAVEGFSA